MEMCSTVFGTCMCIVQAYKRMIPTVDFFSIQLCVSSAARAVYSRTSANDLNGQSFAQYM